MSMVALLHLKEVALTKRAKEMIWFAMGLVGFFVILFAPQLRDPWIVVTIFGLLGLPAFVDMWSTLNREAKNGKNGNGNGVTK